MQSKRRSTHREYKTAGARAPAVRPSHQLLNCDYALHAKREVRHTVVRILSGLDIGERNRDSVARIHLHVARELAHLVRTHVRIKLRFDISGDCCRVERDIVGSTTRNGELDAISLFHRNVRWLEAVSFRVANHFHFVRRARDRSRGCASRARARARRSRRCRTTSRGRRSGARGIDCYVSRVRGVLFSSGARANRQYTNSNRESVKPHFIWPPRAVR
jgi:hypothetical protein